MIKLSLSPDVETKHKLYCENNILPKIKGTDIFEFKDKTFKFEKLKFKDEQEKFKDFIIENFEIFTIGKPLQLKKLHAEIECRYPTINLNIRNLKSDKKNIKSYKDFLIGLFGYEKFGTKNISYYLKKGALKRTDKKIFCVEVENEIIDFLSVKFPELKAIIKNSFFQNGQLIKLNVSEFEKKVKNLDIDLTMDNFKLVDLFDEEWSPYAFVMESGIRVCPYCNRQYITPIYSDQGRLRADLDHFLPKSIYPYFSMSLYNLVPTCKTCNQALKKDIDFSFGSINPYEDNYNDFFSFEIEPISQLLFLQNGTQREADIEKHLKTFKLRTLYSYHNNQAAELMKKRKMYTDEYIEKLYEDHSKSFDSIDQVKELIIGYISSEEHLNDEAFLKLRRDIAKQLNFIKNKPDEKQITELNKILEQGNNGFEIH